MPQGSLPSSQRKTEKNNSTFEFHPFQDEIWCADTDIYHELLLSAGEQGGKSILGALWSRKQLNKWKGKPVAWVVGAPTYKIMEQSTLPTYMKIFTKHLGTYRKQMGVFEFHNDPRTIWFRSGTDPDSVVGIQNVIGGHIDELGKCSRMFYYNVRNRSSRLGGCTLGTTSAYALNFVKREIMDPVVKALDKEHEILENGEIFRSKKLGIIYTRFNSLANPTYDRSTYERMRIKLPHRIFRMRYEGIHDKAEGLIFDEFDDLNLCDPLDLRNAQYYGGIDWGFDHPLAITVRAITENRELYTVSVFKKSGLSVTQQLDLIAAKTRMYGVKHWGCGSDRPDMIQELQNRGISASKYFEYSPEYREVNAGNQKHAELIKEKRLKIFRGIDQWADLVDEYETYQWDKDVNDEEVVKERPLKENDDLMDAERYCTVVTLHLVEPKLEEIESYQRKEFRDMWRKEKTKKSWDAY